jgi:hypothetical protein
MFFRPRQRLRSFAVAALASCALVACAPSATRFVARAQQRRATQAKRPARPAANKADAARLQQKQRRQAVSALLEAAGAARDFATLSDKVAVQASAADALWPFDEQNARAVLLRAWEATRAPGAAESFATDGETPESAREYLKSAQSLVVETAAKHDARLAENFMRELMREDAGAEEAAAATQSREPGRLSAAGQQRLSIASSLLRAGEPQSAARVAAPLIDEGATREMLAFVMELRAQDASQADALYLRLLERTRADVSANANDVLLLSTPVISPELLVYVGQDGALGYAQTFYANASRGGERATPALLAALRRAFFDVAAAVLLRADASPRKGAEAARYFAIGRLLPFFEREAAQHLAALNARQAALGASVDASLRDSLSASTATRSFAHRNPRDPLGQTLEAIGRATNEAERDGLRLRAVEQAARLRLWERARRFVSEITDAETQRSAHLVVALHQVLSISEVHDNEDPEDLERVVGFVRASDVPAEARAVGFVQSAHIALARGRRARALELLAEASAFAAQTPRSPSQQAVLSMLLAHAYARASDARAWEHFSGFVSAANNAPEDFPAKRPGLDFMLRSSSGETYLSITAPVGFEELYATMARLDLARALADMRALEDEVTRAEAFIAAARAVLTRAGVRGVKDASGF